MSKCKMCGDDGAKRRRQRTAYYKDEMNFAILCDRCQKEADEYWRGMWSEYYSQACGLIVEPKDFNWEDLEDD